ncbi:MAG: T9SS type A sorting domain-containing protein [Bacteroidota bacterium]
MRIIKNLLLLLGLMPIYTLSAQQPTVYSDAIGKTVFLEYNRSKNVKTQETKSDKIQLTQLPHPTVYSKGLNKTFFIRNQVTTPARSRVAVDPPNIEFDGVQLNWSSLHADPTLPDLPDFVSGWNGPAEEEDIFFRDSRVVADKLVSLFTININVGSYVDVTDLKTGERLWGNSYSVIDDDKFETYMSVFERNDGDLELTGFRVANVVPNVVPLGPASRRVLDISSGQELGHYVIDDFSAGSCFCINPNAQYGRLLPIVEDEKYLAACMYINSIENTIHWQRTVDGEGYIIDTIGYVSNPINESLTHKYIDAYVLPNGNIAVGVQSYFFPTVFDRFVNELLIISPDGELLNRIDITQETSYSSFFYMSLQGERLFISSISLNEDQTIYNRGNFLVLDQEGNKLASLTDFTEVDGEPIVFTKGTSLDENTSLMFGRSLDAANCLQFFEIDSMGQTKHLRTMCHDEATWQIRPEFAYVEGDDLILQTTWVWDDINHFPASFSMNLNELGFVTHTKGIADNEKDLHFYPNPASQVITVDIPRVDNGLLEVVDVFGKVILSRNIKNEQKIDLLVGDIPSGTYLVNVKYDTEVYASRLAIQ